MEVPAIGGTYSGGLANSGFSDSPATENQRNAYTAVRQLNKLNIENRQFAVVRDPTSHRFVVVVRDGQNGQVLDQFPPEEVLRMLSQLSDVNGRSKETAAE